MGQCREQPWGGTWELPRTQAHFWKPPRCTQDLTASFSAPPRCRGGAGGRAGCCQVRTKRHFWPFSCMSCTAAALTPTLLLCFQLFGVPRWKGFKRAWRLQVQGLGASCRSAQEQPQHREPSTSSCPAPSVPQEAALGCASRRGLGLSGPPKSPSATPELILAPRIWQGFILPTRTGLLEEQGKGQPLRTLKVAARAQPPPWGHGDSPRLWGHGGGTSLIRCTARPSGGFVPPAASRLRRGWKRAGRAQPQPLTPNFSWRRGAGPCRVYTVRGGAGVSRMETSCG